MTPKAYVWWTAFVFGMIVATVFWIFMYRTGTVKP